jgi:N-acetylated-alpha-linked acidic dipeptidase
MSDTMVLPLNTTHYSCQLENYLDKYVNPLPQHLLKLTSTKHRVESIASFLALDVNLSVLRRSIRSLQAKSLKLDAEKHEAERNLTKLIKKWKRRHAKRMGFKRRVKEIACRIAKFFGRSCHKRELSVTVVGKAIKPRVGRFAGWLQEQKECREARLAYGYGIALRPNCVLTDLRLRISIDTRVARSSKP